MSKICSNCGKTVQDDSKFCPYCKSQNFTVKNEVAAPNNTVVHRLFYWNYDGNYVISKAKITSICVFLFFSIVALISGSPAGMIIIALIIAVLVYLIGFSLHQIAEKPSQAKITHNDYGLGEDLKHLLFFWQNDEGGYALSKTKIVSHLVFLLFFAISFQVPNLVLFTQILFAIIFEIPAFLIGYAIHKLTNPNPEAKPIEIKPKKELPKKEVPKPQIQNPKQKVIPEYLDYQIQLDELNSKFKSKEKSLRDLIKKRFEPPQLTYTRFISGVDKSSQLFHKNLESAHTMINLADEYSPRIAGEVESKIDILKSIIEKMDKLANELVLNDDISSKEDVDNLISEMDDLIKSVKNYD